MTSATVALDLNQTLDIQSNIAAQVALHQNVVCINVVADLSLIVCSQILNAGIRVDTSTGENLVGSALANAVNIGQTNLHALFAGQVNTSNTCHSVCTS